MKEIDLRHAEEELSKQGIPDVLYVDQNIAIIDSVRSVTFAGEAFIVNGFVIVIVKSGHAMLQIDNDKFEIHAYDTFICTPRNIIDNAMFSVDFDMFGMIISPQYGQQITRESGLNIPGFAITASHKILHMTETEFNTLSRYHELMSATCIRVESNNRNKILNHIIQAVSLEMFDIFHKEESCVAESSGYTAAEQIFARFVDIMHSDSTPLHTVNEYADRLHITAKYFSAICKQVAGRTASDIINEEIVNSARILLRDPQNSIKMVADKLNFANQSHFGTFMRRHTGMSPQQLRETL